MPRLAFIAAVIAVAATLVAAQLTPLEFSEATEDFTQGVYKQKGDVLWCCLSKEELMKCRAFAEVTKTDHERSDSIFGSYYRNIKCKLYQNKDECMKLIDLSGPSNPDIMTVDAGEVFVGGRYHSLVPILREVYQRDQNYYHSVAVIKRGSMPDVQTLSDLRGMQACFPKVGSLAGWTVPIYKLIDTGVMDIVDCNNHVKSAINFFGMSCAVNSLQDRYNPLGDNSHHFCEACGSDTPGVRCTDRDPYADYNGALNCLREKGDIAFLNDKVLLQEKRNRDDFELLCLEEEQRSTVNDFDDDNAFPEYGAPRGGYGDPRFRRRFGALLSRRPVSEYESCSWGVSPGNALVVSSAMDMKERQALQIFLGKAAEVYSERRRSSGTQSQSAGPGQRGPDRGRPGQRQGDRPFGDSRRPFGFQNQNQRGFNNIFGNNAATSTITNGSTVVSDASGRSRVPEYDLDDADDLDDDDDDDEKEFRLFESYPRYGMLRNLLFSDNTRKLTPVPPGEMSYKEYLGKPYGGSLTSPLRAIEGVRRCPVGDMKLCITSEAELTKCVRMRTALNAQLLEPKMSCKRARSAIDCMNLIRHGEADVTVLDAGDIYRAGWQYGLIPIMAEIYNLGTPHMYAVAVTKQRDNSSELIYLKRKNTCHTGVGHGAGWVIPMAWLIGNERVRDYGCNSVRAAAEYFNKACAPGARSPYFQDRYEADYWEYSHLCDLCHGTASRYCDRNHMEDYFGHTGAFRCLVEGGGNVAFVKHTTVTENCDGKRKEWWARNQLTSDYELLCRDGTRAPAREYKRCFLGKVKSNAIVTSPRYGKQKVDAFINLFKYAQQFYGQKVPDEFSFSMFYSEPPFADLIFQDATQQLVVIDPFERHYTRYLDKEFLKAYSLVECRSAASRMTAAATLAISLMVAVLL